MPPALPGDWLSFTAASALIGHGATVDALGMLDERRPLHYAAAYGAKSALEVLLRAGADPNRAELFHGFTPLHYAASDPHVECVALLLRYGARIPEIGYAKLGTLRSNWHGLPHVRAGRSHMSPSSQRRS